MSRVTASGTASRSVGDPTLADAILDRLVHNAYKFALRGDSVRCRRQEEKP